MEVVSCGAGSLYGRGGFYEEPHLLLRLMSHREPRIRLHEELFPAYCYPRPMPVWIDAPDAYRDRLLAYYAWINRDQPVGAASYLCELSGAVVAHNVLYLERNARRQVVYETHRIFDRPWSPLIEEAVPASPYPVEPGTVYLFLGSVGSFNYGHWLLDDAARLSAVDALRVIHPMHRIVILLPSYGAMEPTLSQKWDEARAAITSSLLDSPALCTVEFLECSRAWSFDRLYYVTPITFEPVLKSPHALAWLAGRFGAPRSRFSPPLPRTRLFVERRPTRGRVLENSASLRALLEQRGFIAIDPEGLSIADQAAAFGAAEVVVGTMGAAMSNTVFCAPDTRVIHLAPEGWNEPFYWDLAAACGHRYAACYGTAPNGGEPHQSAFSVHDDALLRALDAVG